MTRRELQRLSKADLVAMVMDSARVREAAVIAVNTIGNDLSDSARARLDRRTATDLPGTLWVWICALTDDWTPAQRRRVAGRFVHGLDAAQKDREQYARLKELCPVTTGGDS